jgi:hypothetical protein
VWFFCGLGVVDCVVIVVWDCLVLRAVDFAVFWDLFWVSKNKTTAKATAKATAGQTCVHSHSCDETA